MKIQIENVTVEKVSGTQDEFENIVIDIVLHILQSKRIEEAMKELQNPVEEELRKAYDGEFL